MILRAWPVCVVLCSTVAFAQARPCLIQENAVGAVRNGMTIRQVRAALPGAVFNLGEDTDQLAIYIVSRGGVPILDIYPNQDEKINDSNKAELLRVYDPNCATADGVHPGMLLSEVEQKYGKLKRLVLSEAEPWETAEFEKQPAWLEIQTGKGEAGVYPKGKRCAPRYAANAKAESLWVSHAMTNPLPDAGMCDTPPPVRK
jgi:hypothetical protein